MMNKNIWTIKGKKEKVSDKALIEMIKSGELTGSDYIKTRELSKFVRIDDSIYEFYLKGRNDEAI